MQSDRTVRNGTGQPSIRPGFHPQGIVSLVVSAIAIAGCGGQPAGPERAHVAGFVSIDGAPLKSGEIRFIPTAKTKGPAAVAIVSDGAYELGTTEGPIVGSHRVEIASLDEQADDDQAFAAKLARGVQPLDLVPVPAAYNRQSILTAEVTKEGNLQLDFALDSAGTPPAK